MQWLQPRSVIDLGCALGEWLAVFRENGVDEVLGVDGSYVKPQWLQIPEANFQSHDLELLKLRA